MVAHLLKVAAQYSGHQPRPDSRIYSDLDINGSDFIEFVEEVERHYGIYLSVVSSQLAGAEAQDPTIEFLAQEVVRQSS